MKYAIGIDIGGTKIAVSLGDPSGKILARREVATQKGRRARRSLQDIALAIREILIEVGVTRKMIFGIGVCLPGAVDTQKGIVPRSPNLPGWKGIPIRRELQRQTGLPVFLANDANAAALGESLFGAGRKTKNFIYITVSTGIGGGLVLHGQLHEGASFVAGEIGHMSIVPDGLRCKCGLRGCLEAYASGTAIANYVRQRMTKKNTRLWKYIFPKKTFQAKQVGFAAREGDKLCIQSYRYAGYHLGIGIAILLNVLNPAKVVLGGGVLKSAPGVFWKAMIQSCKKHAWPEAFLGVKILRSRLQGQVGDLGALALVFRRENRPAV